jgi:hypothetical protein
MRTETYMNMLQRHACVVLQKQLGLFNHKGFSLWPTNRPLLLTSSTELQTAYLPVPNLAVLRIYFKILQYTRWNFKKITNADIQVKHLTLNVLWRYIIHGIYMWVTLQKRLHLKHNQWCFLNEEHCSHKEVLK